MISLVILIISLVISLFVIIPLVRGLITEDKTGCEKGVSSDGAFKRNLYDLERKKDLIISEILDIDFDYGLGKLNRQDYNEIKYKYKLKAAEILKQIDKIKEVESSKGRSDKSENKIQSDKVNKEM